MITIASVESEVRRFLEDFLRGRELTGSATLTEYPAGGRRSGIAFKLTAANPGAAAVSIIVENGIDLIYAFVGKGTPLEIPIDAGRYTDSSGLDELREVLECVVTGGFSEDFWQLGRCDLLIVGEFSLKGGAVRVSNVRLPVLARLVGKRRHVSYAPYGRGEACE